MKAFFAIFLFVGSLCFSQTMGQKLDKGIKNLLASSAACAANMSVFVADSSGKLVYEYNGNRGLSTASTQKIFTAACALETLGRDYRYTTSASYSGTLNDGILSGSLYITSNGDPTLGSWRYDGYKPEDFAKKLLESIKKVGITKISGDLIVDDSAFDFQTVPGGWPWDDMGNYYGVGVWGVNWRENQFDLKMNGKEMKDVNVELPDVKWVNAVQTAGSSDQSIIFTAPHSDVAYISGTLPAKTLTVSGSMPNPPLTLGYEIKNWLKQAGISLDGKVTSVSEQLINKEKIADFPKKNVFFSYQSPTLDKLVYWFLRKSVNLYGETFIKTLAREKRNSGSFKAGVDFLEDFWKSKGINAMMINFADGSGLSPQNYVSARAEVQALLYAQKQPWFDVYFEGFPTHDNGMKMKSGTMKNTKSYAGIYKGYVFSIIINNYQGSDAGSELEKILNSLK